MKFHDANSFGVGTQENGCQCYVKQTTTTTTTTTVPYFDYDSHAVNCYDGSGGVRLDGDTDAGPESGGADGSARGREDGGARGGGVAAWRVT